MMIHQPFFRYCTLACSLIFVGCTQTDNAAPSDNARIILDSADRSDSNKARDAFRHPDQTLAFFGFKPDATVVEVWPGKGWYTEILAPSLHAEGTLYAAHFAPDSPVKYFNTSRQKFEQKMAAAPALYENVTLTSLAPPAAVAIAPAASADAVYTFRNVHNWMRKQQERLMFDAFFTALKPGGILGVVEHRAPASFSYDEMIKSGYVTEQHVIDTALAAGFTLVATSQINANPLDTKQHPNGVWSLPPTLRVDDDQKAAYAAIGESDRMTLKFQKPM